MRIKVDYELCQGHGGCAADAPDVFDVDEKRGVVIVKLERPPESLREQVETAVRFCPTRALRIEE
jgi:ferredoxin